METETKVLLANLTQTEAELLKQILRHAMEGQSEMVLRLELIDITEIKCTCGECENHTQEKMKEAHAEYLKAAQSGLENLKSLYHKLK